MKRLKTATFIFLTIAVSVSFFACDKRFADDSKTLIDETLNVSLSDSTEPVISGTEHTTSAEQEITSEDSTTLTASDTEQTASAEPETIYYENCLYESFNVNELNIFDSQKFIPDVEIEKRTISEEDEAIEYVSCIIGAWNEGLQNWSVTAVKRDEENDAWCVALAEKYWADNRELCVMFDDNGEILYAWIDYSKLNDEKYKEWNTLKGVFYDNFNVDNTEEYDKIYNNNYPDINVPEMTISSKEEALTYGISILKYFRANGDYLDAEILIICRDDENDAWKVLISEPLLVPGSCRSVVFYGNGEIVFESWNN